MPPSRVRLLVDKFLALAAARGRLLHGSTVYLDGDAAEAVAWLGGARFLLGLGVRNVLALDDAAASNDSPAEDSSVERWPPCVHGAPSGDAATPGGRSSRRGYH